MGKVKKMRIGMKKVEKTRGNVVDIGVSTLWIQEHDELRNPICD